MPGRLNQTNTQTTGSGRLNAGTPQAVTKTATVSRLKTTPEVKKKLTQAEIDAIIKAKNAQQLEEEKKQGIKQGTFANYGKSLGETSLDFLKGAAKGAGQSLEFFSGVGEKVLQTPLKLAGVKVPEKTSAQSLREVTEKKLGVKKGELFKANTTGEKIGKTTEQVAEYLIPGTAGYKVGKAAQASKLLTNAPKIVGRLAPYVIEGAVDAATSLPLLYSQAEPGEPVTGKDVAINTAISLAAPGATKLLGKAGRLFKNKSIQEAALATEETVAKTLARNAEKKTAKSTLMQDIIPPTNKPTGIAKEVQGTALNAEIRADKSMPIGTKESRFAKGVAGSDITAPEVSKGLTDNAPTYEVKRNIDIQNKAVQMVKENASEAENFVLNESKPSAEHTATAVELIKKMQNEGNFEGAIRIADDVSKKLTEAGQAIQAAKLYENLSPESVLVKAKSFINKENKKANIFQKTKQLTEADAQTLYDTAKKMQNATGDAKQELSNEIASILAGYQNNSVLKKLSSIQTQAQLLNPKTTTRNVIGNELFYRVERLTKMLATPIDIARSTLTGTERTVTMKKGNQKQYWSDWFKGAQAGWKGVQLGPDTQFQLPVKTFNNKWNPFYWGEKAVGATLKSFDYAAYNRARLETLYEMGWLRAKREGAKGKELKQLAQKYADNADNTILEIADQYGKYTTFQDDNVISKMAIGLKKGLNVSKDFGLGDLVLKYPKTPGALMSRALEYSPAGFLKAAKEVATPIYMGRAKTLAENKELAMTVSRAITGTLGFTGLGYYFADKGFLTGRQSKDKDVASLQKSVGQGKYQMNLSAIKRWVLSGFKNTSIKAGDLLYTYDWAQPIAVSLSVGTNMNQTPTDNVLSVGEQIASGAQTITEQPLLSGLTRLFGYGDPLGGLQATAEGAASSFSPTILNQFRQYTDNQTRSTKSDSSVQTAINLTKNKIPGLDDTLTPKYDVLGEPVQNMEKNNIFNVFFSPGAQSTFKENPETKLILDLISSTGETKQVPRVIPDKQTILGEQITVDPNDYAALQRYAGQRTMQGMSRLLEQPAFNELDDAEKIKVLTNNLTDVGVGVRGLLTAKKLIEVRNTKGDAAAAALEKTLKPADLRNVQNAINYLKANPTFFNIDMNPKIEEKPKKSSMLDSLKIKEANASELSKEELTQRRDALNKENAQLEQKITDLRRSKMTEGETEFDVSTGKKYKMINGTRIEVKSKGIKRDTPVEQKGSGELKEPDLKVISTVVAEALGEGEEGMQAVLNVINNRAAKNNTTPFDEVAKPAQFSAFSSDNKIYQRVRDYLRGKKIELTPDEKKAVEFVKNMVTNGTKDITGGATHYANIKDSTDRSWFDKIPKTGKIGRHTFFKES
jgi:spore germination cell wall hydrolase CwlJ-like protein